MSDIAEVMGGAGINTAEYDEPIDMFAPLPAGWYPAEVEKYELKKTQAGTGVFLHLQFSVSGEKYANRKLFTNINIKNPHPTCERIGQAELASLARALGIGTLSSSDQLAGGTLDVRVIIGKEPNNKGELENEIKGYAPLGKGGDKTTQLPVAARPTSPPSAVQAQPQTQQVQAPAAAPSAGKRPWER